MYLYTMTLKTQAGRLAIPVLPEKLEVSSPGKNDKTVTLGLGEVLLLRAKGLRSVTWDSFFPAHAAPYSTQSVPNPVEAVRAIQAARDALKPIRFLLTGGDLDINTDMGVESFHYEERYGEVGDLYYSIQLTEWKSYAPRRLELPLKPEDPAILEASRRAGAPEPPKTYTVVKGDSLWAVARRSYGSGDGWTKIYAANRAAIGPNPNLIYPGQVLTIP